MLLTEIPHPVEPSDVPELLTSGGMAVVENRVVEHLHEVVHRLQKGIVVVWNASLVDVAANDCSGRHHQVSHGRISTVIRILYIFDASMREERMEPY